MAETLDQVFGEIAAIQREARAKPAGDAVRPRWPMIILRSPKGWTGPKEIDGKKAEDHWRSHQVPMANVAGNPKNLAVLEQWLRSYRAEELFDDEGRLLPELRSVGPEGHEADGREPPRQRRSAPARPAAAGLPRLRGRRSQPGHDDRGVHPSARRLPAGCHEAEPRGAELPGRRPRRARLEPPGRPVRGHRPGLARGSDPRRTTTCRPTAG